jgi:putative ABC transport system ATP-binding protein
VQAAFALTDVTVTRGVGAHHAHPLSAVSVEIAAGRCTALVGPSGAGKSTLLRLLNRMDDPSAGQVLFHGRPIDSYPVLELRRRVGMVQQSPVLLTERVGAELRVGDPTVDDAHSLALLADVGLGPEFLARDTAGLSGGEAQRLCVARALSVRPEALLLDEPTSALDAFAAHAVENALAALVHRGLTTVLVSHDLQQARRLADDVVVLVGGHVVDAGPAARVYADPATPQARRFLEGVL